MDNTVLMIGCGRLGCAILKRWLDKLPLATFFVLEPTPGLELLQLVEPYGHRVTINPTRSFTPDIVLLAVKPQTVDDALARLKTWLPATTLVISVAAGVRLDRLRDGLSPDQPIVRAMPNVAALVGEAATVCVANKKASNAHLEAAAQLMKAIGTVEWISDEQHIDTVTALSGSGPGYAFLFTEELARAGIDAGLPEKLAMQLARQTMIGVGALLKQSAQSVEELRASVTSPAGTTEAGLKILLQDKTGLKHMIGETVAAAKKRAAELS